MKQVQPFPESAEKCFTWHRHCGVRAGMSVPRFVWFLFWVTVLVPGAPAAQSIARVWDEQIISAIRIDRPNPPVHARNLFHFSVAMYDAWAAYDPVATG